MDLKETLLNLFQKDGPQHVRFTNGQEIAKADVVHIIIRKLQLRNVVATPAAVANALKAMALSQPPEAFLRVAERRLIFAGLPTHRSQWEILSGSDEVVRPDLTLAWQALWEEAPLEHNGQRYSRNPLQNVLQGTPNIPESQIHKRAWELKGLGAIWTEVGIGAVHAVLPPQPVTSGLIDDSKAGIIRRALPDPAAQILGLKLWYAEKLSDQERRLAILDGHPVPMPHSLHFRIGGHVARELLADIWRTVWSMQSGGRVHMSLISLLAAEPWNLNAPQYAQVRDELSRWQAVRRISYGLYQVWPPPEE